MKITDEQLNHIAALARLRLAVEERAGLRKDLGNIVAYVEKLNELDVNNIEPTLHALPQANVFLRPEADNFLSAKDALRNAPRETRGFFEVPRVIEEA